MCAKISRRSAPGSHQKQSKRPNFFRRYAPGDSPPDFPTHITYVSTALFCNLVSSGGPEGDGEGLSLVPYWPNK